MKTVIVMPAYNEATVIGQVVNKVKDAGFSDIVVVDDGSKDNTAYEAEIKGARVVRHLVNRGLGGALGTGLAAAIKLNADIIVTLDSDGQHDAEEINKIIEPIKSERADCVLGYRTYPESEMPKIRKLFNHVGNLVTYFLFGALVKDSQSGFRAFSNEAARSINIRSSRMEASSEIVEQIFKKNLKLEEVPIKAIYTDYSLSKGQNFFVGLKTLWKLIFYKLRS